MSQKQTLSRFKCGHAKVDDNSYPVGNGFMRCLTCKRAGNVLAMRWKRRRPVLDALWRKAA